MTGVYDSRLVALSVVIAVFASYAALDLAGRITASHNKARLFWLTGGATSMGLGIWSMHYIGMLAFRMSMPMFYFPPTVMLSLLAAIAASAVALYTVSRSRMGTLQLVLGSIFMGAGIAAMHYIGMAAMRVAARVQYDPALVTLSIVLAIGISTVALLLAFRGREEKRTHPQKFGAALVMGSAIPIMHYTGMAAATFFPTGKPLEIAHAVSISSLGITAISVGTLLVLAMVIVASFLDRLLAAQRVAASEAKKGEIYFQTLADAIPQIVFTARPDGDIDFYNKRWYEFTGKDPKKTGDWGWNDVLHPDDVELCAVTWQSAVQSGTEYDVECRFCRHSDNTYRWHLGRAVPLFGVDGKIVKWFGTCTDIEDQKRNQRELEEEVRLRTEELVTANARLIEEMNEKGRTQKELDNQTQQLVHELKERSQNNALLANMGQLLQTCTTMTEAFAIILGFAPRMFPNLRGAVILLNASRSMLEVVGQWADCKLDATVLEPNCCWALRTGHSYLVNAGETGVACGHASTVKGSYLCIPIQAHGEALGLIHFQAAQDGHRISELEASLAATFAEQTGLSIANIRLREALRSQSIRDSLTGLFNRRYLEETLEREVHRAARTKQSLGVIMVDLDHFKRFNDDFGHDAGDVVLHEMGKFFARHTRADDIACRYGGEELVLILPNADVESTRMRAEQLRVDAKDLAITQRGKPLGVVTLSSGVAAFPEHGSSPRQLMAAADAALYRAKKQGRDQVVVADSGWSAEPEAAAAQSAGKS
jgi:diguanylate cyclase (GGDEF)-like protein/PAS domain S-box-containing protein